MRLSITTHAAPTPLRCIASERQPARPSPHCQRQERTTHSTQNVTEELQTTCNWRCTLSLRAVHGTTPRMFELARRRFFYSPHAHHITHIHTHTLTLSNANEENDCDNALWSNFAPTAVARLSSCRRFPTSPSRAARSAVPASRRRSLQHRRASECGDWRNANASALTAPCMAPCACDSRSRHLSASISTPTWW